MDQADAAAQFTGSGALSGDVGVSGSANRRVPPGVRRNDAYPGEVTQPERPHRPIRRADLSEIVEAVAAVEPFARAELAAATAAAVITQGRAAGSESLVDLADRVGLETLAELWRDEQPSSLPGALWALYVLRRWCYSQGDEVARLWRAGRPYAPADEVVAGVADDPDPEAVAGLADSVLSGAYGGDFAVALERAASFFRVVAEGRRQTCELEPDPGNQLTLARRNDETADGLALAALRWRENPL
jgi:hypothetical protein